MSKTDKTETDKTEVKKRKMLTPEERVAAAAAALEAAKQQMYDKDRKRHAQLSEQYKVQVAKLTDIQAKIEAINAEVGEIEKRLPVQPSDSLVAEG